MIALACLCSQIEKNNPFEAAWTKLYGACVVIETHYSVMIIGGLKMPTSLLLSKYPNNSLVLIAEKLRKMKSM